MISSDACSSAELLCTVAVEVDADGFVVGRRESVDENKLRRPPFDVAGWAPCCWMPRERAGGLEDMFN